METPRFHFIIAMKEKKGKKFVRTGKIKYTFFFGNPDGISGKLISFFLVSGRRTSRVADTANMLNYTGTKNQIKSIIRKRQGVTVGNCQFMLLFSAIPVLDSLA